MIGNTIKAKGIFLDLDGTIVDSTGAYLEAAKVGFLAVGQQPPTAKIALEIPRRIEQGLTLNDIIEGDPKAFSKAYIETYYSATKAKTRLLPNISATLYELSARAKLALITMRHVSSKTIQRELATFGIAQHFSHVITALDTAKPKPAPEALIKCVEALDLQMHDCLITGDSVNDVRAGKAAGAKTVALLSGLFRHEELVKEAPDLILPDLTLLPSYLG